MRHCDSRHIAPEMDFLDAPGLDMHGLVLLKAAGGRGLNLLDVNVSDLGILAVEDLGDLLEGGALGLDIEEANEEEFDENPNL